MLEDVGADHGDDIARQLNQLGTSYQVENELAALKAQSAIAAVRAPSRSGRPRRLSPPRLPAASPLNERHEPG